MLLSQPQQTKFWAIWNKACEVQGWTREAGFSAADITAARKRLLSLAGFTSLTLVDPLEGFDRVLEQLAILRDDMSGVASAAGMKFTRLKVAIRTLADEAFIAKLVADRFTFAVWLRNTFPSLPRVTLKNAPDWLAEKFRQSEAHAATLDDLDEHELTQLVVTCRERTRPASIRKAKKQENDLVPF